MKKVKICAAVVLSMLLLTACGAGEEGADRDSYQKISTEEAKTIMEEGNVTIVDVRTPEEYEGGHVPGAVNIPNETIGREVPEGLPDREASILVYCRSGRRSAEAAGKLAELGYGKVYDFGGIVDWPYETETGSGNDQNGM